MFYRLLFMPLLFLALATPVFAQTTGTLGESPAIIESTLTPAQTIKGQVTLFNLTTSSLPVHAFATSFSPKEVINLSAEKRNIYDASQWITFATPDVILQPQSHQTIQYTIQAPANAEHGGHYATIFFQPLTATTPVSPNVELVERVGTLVFLTIPGEIRESVHVSNFHTPRFVAFGSPEFTASLTNDGNIHTRPHVRMDVLDWRGQVVTTIPFDEGLLVPGTTKTYTASFHTVSLPSVFAVRLTVTYGTDQHQLVEIDHSFWLLPALPVIALVIFGVFVVIVLFLLRTRLRAVLHELVHNDEKNVKKTQKDHHRAIDKRGDS